MKGTRINSRPVTSGPRVGFVRRLFALLVNVLSPGATATDLAKEALGEEGLKAYGSMTALQRMGDPAEVGAAAAFLASSDSSFMTGSEVAVDGGLAQI